jgi:hypothetical protein
MRSGHGASLQATLRRQCLEQRPQRRLFRSARCHGAILAWNQPWTQTLQHWLYAHALERNLPAPLFRCFSIACAESMKAVPAPIRELEASAEMRWWRTSGAPGAFSPRVPIRLVNDSPRSRHLWHALEKVPLTARREGYRSSFSAKSFYAGKIWLPMALTRITLSPSNAPARESKSDQD